MELSVVNKYNTFGKRFWAGLIDALVFIPFTILHSSFGPGANSSLLLGLQGTELVLWTLYLVIGHGKYGQTLGKKAMGLKVLDISEQGLIGYKRAFLREAILFFFTAGTIAYIIIRMNGPAAPTLTELRQNDLSFYFPIGWFAIELITTLTNKKYRAVHDYIAGSVVIRLDGKDPDVA